MGRIHAVVMVVMAAIALAVAPPASAWSVGMSWSATAFEDAREISGAGEHECFLLCDLTDAPGVVQMVYANWYFAPGVELLEVEGMLEAAPDTPGITDRGHGLYEILISFDGQCELVDGIRSVARFSLAIDPTVAGPGVVYGIGVIPDDRTPAVILRNSSCFSPAYLRTPFGAIFVAHAAVPTALASWRDLEATCGP